VSVCAFGADESDSGIAGAESAAGFRPIALNAHGGGVEIKCTAVDDDVAGDGDGPVARCRKFRR